MNSDIGQTHKRNIVRTLGETMKGKTLLIIALFIIGALLVLRSPSVTAGAATFTSPIYMPTVPNGEARFYLIHSTTLHSWQQHDVEVEVVRDNSTGRDYIIFNGTAVLPAR